MIKDGAIPFKDSDALELKDRQDKVIAAEANRLYASAVKREVTNENPEAGKARSELDFLGSLQQGSAVVDDMRDNAKKAHEKWMTDHGAAQRRQEELDRYRAELENSRPRQPKLEEMGAEAEQCGFRLTVQNGVFSGFEDSHHRKWAISNGQTLDAVDLRLIFLITRACDALNWPGPVDSNPKVCNGSASTLGARKEKLAALESGLSGGALECRNEILARTWKISDDKSFGKVVEAFNKRWNKNLKAREDSGGDRESSGGRERSSAPPRSEHGDKDNTTVTPPKPPIHDADGEARRQLEEIERRKRWGVRPVR